MSGDERCRATTVSGPVHPSVSLQRQNPQKKAAAPVQGGGSKRGTVSCRLPNFEVLPVDLRARAEAGDIGTAVYVKVADWALNLGLAVLELQRRVVGQPPIQTDEPSCLLAAFAQP